MKKLIILLTILTLAYLNLPQATALSLSEQHAASDHSDKILSEAFENQRGNLQIEGNGIVVKILPDDRHGSRHQRFIIQLGSGQTVLIAHNIDLAPKIDQLHKGDMIEFSGEYEWNNKGGVIHWTHHDPSKRHAGGWLKHKERLYQ